MTFKLYGKNPIKTQNTIQWSQKTWLQFWFRCLLISNMLVGLSIYFAKLHFIHSTNSISYLVYQTCEVAPNSKTLCIEMFTDFKNAGIRD